ncbi:hypothetical protein N9166_00285 [bacterium]|nr:hypothetical protein [bacterium]
MRRAFLAASALCAACLTGVARAEEALESRAEAGPVSATLRLTPAEPVIGDPLRLELEVRAEPGVELLMPEFGEALDRFRIVDFAPSERLDADGATVSRQRYTLQPARSGPQSVPPLLIEFIDRRPGHSPAPEGDDAYELLTESLDFEVAAVLPEGAPLELRPALGTLAPRAGPGPRLWPYLLAGALALGAVAPFAVRAWLAGRAERRRLSAYDVARGELDALLYAPRPGPGGMDAFYVKLSGIVRHYLEDRFALRSPELTTEEFLDELAGSPDLYRSHRDLLREFLHGADLVKFAHHVPGPEAVEKSIQAAQRFVEETREAAHA